MRRSERVVIVLMLLVAACGGTAREISSGNANYRDGDYEAALMDYQAAQVAAPDRPEAYYNAAAPLIAANRLDAAIAALQQALETADDDLAASAYYNLGNAYYELGRYQDAVAAYQQSLILRPEDTNTRYNLELALLFAIPPTPTAAEQQTNPDSGESDPETTPTDQPGGFDGPTPTPPPQDVDPSATPGSGEGLNGDEDSATPIPMDEGEMTVEQAERILDQIQQEQEALSAFLDRRGGVGAPNAKDW